MKSVKRIGGFDDSAGLAMGGKENVLARTKGATGLRLYVRNSG
jgi:hypothetical protein